MSDKVQEALLLASRFVTANQRKYRAAVSPSTSSAPRTQLGVASDSKTTGSGSATTNSKT
jgi:hypothetical protein